MMRPTQKLNDIPNTAFSAVGAGHAASFAKQPRFDFSATPTGHALTVTGLNQTVGAAPSIQP